MNHNDLATTASSRPAALHKEIFAIAAASSGNLIEWFDFFIYSYCSIYFASAFFPSDNKTVQLLNTAGVFAIGFLMRPVGGWLFGGVADRRGRKDAMLLSIALMCVGSLGIAVLPTYAQIGALAPVLLVLVRCVQGLSIGGEYGTTATYMSEVVQGGKRGFLASFQYLTLIGGQLCALVLVFLLQQVLTHEQLVTWGWRIPFAIGAFGALVSGNLRRSLCETASERARTREKAGTIAGLMAHKRAVLTVLGLTAGGSLSYYTFSTYMQKYLVNSAGLRSQTANSVMTAALVVFMLLQPVFGALSDLIGRRRSLIAWGSLATLGTVPLLETLRGVTNPYMAFALITTSLVVLSLYTSIAGLMKAELFPPEVRAIGVSLPYAIANALFGGTAEYVALSFKSAGMEPMFYWYVTAVLAVALLSAIFMREPRTSGYLCDLG